MGMFDHIVCEVDLPGSPPSGLAFQSKSLARELSTYIITKNGRLLKKRHKLVELREGETPRYSRHWIFRGKQYVKHPATRTIAIKIEPLDMDYHGDIIFYAYSDSSGWYEYMARFTEGWLSWIRENAS